MLLKLSSKSILEILKFNSESISNKILHIFEKKVFKYKI